MTLAEQAAAWLAAGRTAVLVEVVGQRGSVPRDSGARLLVAADAVAGNIGGGHLEWQAMQFARARLGAADEHLQTLALGPALGQCCGGEVRLRYAPLTAAELAAWPADAPRWPVQLHGAGHVGQALAPLLATLPCSLSWVDEREDAFPHDIPPSVRTHRGEPAEDPIADAPPGCCFLVMTHRHDLDLRLCEAVLRRGDFGFLGLIGSQSKAARFRARLQQRGVPEDKLARLVCPVGLPGVVGKEPAVIAVAVVAQVLMWRSGAPA